MVPSLAAVRKAFDNCTWGNTRETAEDWFTLHEGTDETAKRRLFGRIFLEAPDSTIIQGLRK